MNAISVIVLIIMIFFELKIQVHRIYADITVQSYKHLIRKDELLCIFYGRDDNQNDWSYTVVILKFSAAISHTVLFCPVTSFIIFNQ